MRKEINIKNLKKSFIGSGTYHILFGKTGSVDITADTWEDLVSKYSKYIKKYPNTTGYVHCITKIAKIA